MKTEFESRIEFRKIKLRARRQPVYQATIYWCGKFYEAIRATKELCIKGLEQKCGYGKTI